MTDTAIRTGADGDVAFIEEVCDQVDGLQRACLSGRLPATPKVQDALRQTLAQLVAIPLPLSDVELTLRRDRAALLLADMMARVSSQVTGAVPVVTADMAPPVEVARVHDPLSPWPIPAAALPLAAPEWDDAQPETGSQGIDAIATAKRHVPFEEAPAGELDGLEDFFSAPVATEPPRRRGRRAMATLLVLALAGGAGAAGWYEWQHHRAATTAASAANAGASAPVPAGGWTVVGDVNLTDTAFAGSAEGRQCSGENTAAYRDTVPGATVTVEDQTGAVVGSGQLEPGTITALTSAAGTCQFEFSVSSLPDRPAYQFQVGHRPFVDFTKGRLVAVAWNPQLTFGS